MRFPPVPWIKAVIASSVLLTLACSPQGSRTIPAAPASGLSSESLTEKGALFFAQSTANPYWQKRWWLEKSARLLRGGQGISSTDDVEALMKLGEEEIVRTLMKDERFIDTILDFNSYFLGFKPNEIRYGSDLNPMLLELSSAVASAREVTRDGDYFRLFDMTAPLFIPPFGTPSRQGDDEKNLEDWEVRQKHAREMQEGLRKIQAFAEKPGVTTEAACAEINKNNRVFFALQSDGYPNSLVFHAILLNPDWFGKIRFACRPTAPANPRELIAALGEIIFRNDAFFQAMAKFEPKTGYTSKNLGDLREIDPRALSLGSHWPAFGLEQAVALRNSSTNMNRKRSAYMLKHFFCDDLTPLGFESPESHTGGKHGSDTSCYACHYKLDPMAGFFRNFGLLFSDHSRSDLIQFDDLAIVKRSEYVKEWRAPAQAGREWNIGYIRSASSSGNNAYGESLTDLSRIIRTAPEAKKCLVKRMFEYFVAKNQTVDAGYLQHLTDALVRESSTSSVTAVKNTIARLLLSNAYREYDMDPKQCYDYAPGEAPKDNLRTASVPCRVAYLLNSNCVKCHDNKDDDLHGNLDLSSWVDTGGGVMGFPHLDKQGRQRPARETLGVILERLASSDSGKRMPLKKLMSSQDRQELYSWAQETIQTLHSGGAK